MKILSFPQGGVALSSAVNFKLVELGNTVVSVSPNKLLDAAN